MVWNEWPDSEDKTTSGFFGVRKRSGCPVNRTIIERDTDANEMNSNQYCELVVSFTLFQLRVVNRT
jgi:hypothetical protein